MNTRFNLYSIAWIYRCLPVETRNYRYTSSVCKFNPFMPSGLFYLTSLDRFISNIGGAWLVFIITMSERSF